MRKWFSIMVLLVCCWGNVWSQVGQEAGIGFYGGTSFLSHVQRGDDYQGHYDPDRSRAYFGGIGIYQPITRWMGLGLEVGFQQHTLSYRYGTDRIGTKVLSDMTYFSFLAVPALTFNPKALRGTFARLAVPLAVKSGNRGSYILRYPQNNFVEVDYSAQIADYRRTLYIGPEISLGYMFAWKNGTGIWIRGSTWRAATTFWKYSFTATPELPTLKRLSIEVGFRFGTPRLRLFKFPEKSKDPTEPTLKERLRDQPWINPGQAM
jgi:hypothetical protein